MSVDSVRFNTPIATPVATPVATPAPAAASKPSFSGEGAPAEEKKGGHTGMWLLGLAAVGVAGILIHKKMKAKDAEKLIRTFKKDGATLEVLEKADKEGKISRSFVKKNDKGEVISTTVREYGEKGTKYKYAKQTVEDAKKPVTEPAQEAAKPATEVAQEAAKPATYKKASSNEITNRIAKNDAEIIKGEEAVIPSRHDAKAKELTEAFSSKNVMEHQADNAKKSVGKGVADILDAQRKDLLTRTNYINHAKNEKELTDAFKNYKVPTAIKSKKTVVPSAPAAPASTTTVKYGKTKAGHEYLLEKNANGKVESLIIGNNSPITSPNGIKKAIKKHKINLQG